MTEKRLRREKHKESNERRKKKGKEKNLKPVRRL